MERTFRLGLVGCGSMGRNHLDTVARLPQVEVSAICDVVPKALQQSGEAYHVEARYTEFDRMYDEVKPDFVTVATQTRGHHAPTVAALERGISVLCEKPIAIDLVEADEMVDAAASTNAKLAVNHQNHLNPGILKAKALVEEGRIGDIVMLRGRNKAGRRSGNEFMEMGTHIADMMLCFAGLPEWVAGTIITQGRLADGTDIMEAKEMSQRDRDSGLVMGDRAIGQYGFAGGILGEIHFPGYEQRIEHNYGVDILGTEGQLSVRARGGLPQKLWHLPRPMEGLPSELGDWQAVDLPEGDSGDGKVELYRRLLDAIGKGEDPPSSGEEGRRAFEMILGIYHSHRAGGRRVSMPLDERRHPLEVWRSELGS